MNFAPSDILANIEEIMIKVDDMSTQVIDITDEITTTLNTVIELVLSIQSIIRVVHTLGLPVIITILSINTLNIGVFLLASRKPAYDRSIYATVNDEKSSITKEKRDGLLENLCFLSVEYTVDDIRYDYLFKIVNGKDSYIKKKKIKIYYDIKNPGWPSIEKGSVSCREKVGKIIIASSLCATTIAWLSWYFVLL